MGKICFLRKLSANILDIYLQNSGSANVTEGHKNKAIKRDYFAATASYQHLVLKIKIVIDKKKKQNTNKQKKSCGVFGGFLGGWGFFMNLL